MPSASAMSANAQAFILQVALMDYLNHLHLLPVGAGVGALDDVALHANADPVLGELGNALLLGANQGLHPGGHIVEQVVLRELELGNERHRQLLGNDGQSLGAHGLQPSVAVRVVAQGHVQRSPAHPHHLGQHISLPGLVVGDSDGPAEVAHAELGQHL